MAKVTAANKDTAAGLLGIDRKSYRIRTAAKFPSDKDPLDVVIFEDGHRQIRLRDIASSRIGHEPQFVSIMEGGGDSIVIIVRRQRGTNVLDVINRVRETVDWLNADVLSAKNLEIKWNYDEAPYILKAINIVKKNVLIGGLLAVCAAVVFKKLRSTLVTAMAIPISAIGTFIFLWLFHRNLNVVSLAGISFAVGMLVDNSIVVLENIDRHRLMGKNKSGGLRGCQRGLRCGYCLHTDHSSGFFARGFYPGRGRAALQGYCHCHHRFHFVESGGVGDHDPYGHEPALSEIKA